MLAVSPLAKLPKSRNRTASQRRDAPIFVPPGELGDSVLVPIVTRSESNLRGSHWTRTHRLRLQRRTVDAYARARLRVPTLPCKIILTRWAPRLLDGHDNLRTALKAPADSIAAWLGIKDNDPRVEWLYGQFKTNKRNGMQPGVRIEVLAC